MVKSRTTTQFRKAFARLPKQVQDQICEAYRQFRQDPGHPSLRFKRVHPELPIYSARISKNYRAVGQLDQDTIIWFWVGSHTEYDRLLSQL
ncbi:type II toxin-antitoxin system RelE family toxin [Microcoleus sp. A6-C5]|uniref:type II toxin-antitoxin system RelE family toxin n=1 Tax=unclassified Microcoleus TaxID=2642155 RepID=UPI003FA5C924